jgi:hypothetical protein
VKTAWKPAWFEEGVRRRESTLWRGVEAQHLVATMRLVDDLAEQAALESLLEGSKPPLPSRAVGMHFLLFTPFRYRSPMGSRFRTPGDPGIWYGARERVTACAELAYWRWRFVRDSEGLAGLPVHTEHTLFEAHVKGRCVDLLSKPWDAARSAWAHRSEYGSCQALARECRTRHVAWIHYESARHPGGVCGAVLDPAALSLAEPLRQQTWACKTTREGSYMRHAASGEAFEFPASRWG